MAGELVRRMAVRLLTVLANKDNEAGSKNQIIVLEYAADKVRESCRLESVDKNFQLLYSLMAEWGQFTQPDSEFMSKMCFEADRMCHHALTGAASAEAATHLCSDEGDKGYMLWSYCLRQVDRSRNRSRSSKLQRIKFLLEKAGAWYASDSNTIHQQHGRHT